MKKSITTIILAGLLTVSLLGCSKQTDPAAQLVIDEITALVEADSVTGDDIEKAKERYNSLTDAQKNQVTNYADLLKLEDAYEEYVNSVIAAEEYKKTHYGTTDFLKVSEALGKSYTETFDEDKMEVVVKAKSGELNDLFWGYIEYLQENFTYKYLDSFGCNVAIDSQGNILHDLSTWGDGIKFEIQLK